MLLDYEVGYEEVKEALVSRKVTSHVAAAEAYYSFSNKELLDLPVTQVFTKLKKWLVKMEDNASTEDLRSTLWVMVSSRAEVVH